MTVPAFWECLADVLAELRQAPPKVDLIDISYWSRASQGAVSRFESHESQPRDLDRLVRAYAKACSGDAAAIMREAVDRWEAAGSAELPTSPFDLPQDGQIARRAQAESQRKTARARRAKRDQERRRENG